MFLVLSNYVVKSLEHHFVLNLL